MCVSRRVTCAKCNGNTGALNRGALYIYNSTHSIIKLRIFSRSTRIFFYVKPLCLIILVILKSKATFISETTNLFSSVLKDAHFIIFL